MDSRGLLNKPIRLTADSTLKVLSGSGMAAVVEMTAEEARKLAKMSQEARSAYIKPILVEWTKETKGYAGRCRVLRKNVKTMECVRCAGKRRRFKSPVTWEACFRQNILDQDVEIPKEG